MEKCCGVQKNNIAGFCDYKIYGISLTNFNMGATGGVPLIDQTSLDLPVNGPLRNVPMVVGAVNEATILFSCCKALFVLNLNYSSEKKYIHSREIMKNLNGWL